MTCRSPLPLQFLSLPNPIDVLPSNLPETERQPFGKDIVSILNLTPHLDEGGPTINRRPRRLH